MTTFPVPATLAEAGSRWPHLHRAFSLLHDGEEQYRRIALIDRYWSSLGKPAPRVIHDGSALSPEARISGTFELFYAGGTLALLHGAVMAARHKRSVMVIDRYTPGRTTRDWNISRPELMRLAETGVFSPEELDGTIVRRYRNGWVEFHKPDGSQKRLWMDNVLDCAVDADRLLGMARAKIQAEPDCLVRGECAFSCCYRFDDHLVIETEEQDGRRSWWRAGMLVDAMGILSPIAMQLNGGLPQTHVCPTVGTIASGFESADYQTGEILKSTGPADLSSGSGRQLIWEGFPAKGREYITYLFFYDRADSGNDKSMLALFDTYFRLLAEYKKPGEGFRVHRPVYGIIPAWYHEGFGSSRVIADDRILMIGDAASLGSPLTFCGFGSVVRNIERLTSGLEACLAAGRFAKASLRQVSAWEPNVAAMANLMKYMCFDRTTDEENFVNDLMNEVMVVLDELPPRYREAMFRDEMKIEELVTVMLRVASRYPRVLKATWEKLGIEGSFGFMKNLAGWAFSSIL